jgi:hypothetical protein
MTLKRTPVLTPLSIRLTRAQVGALQTLAEALDNPTEASVAERALSLGLFVLGLDRTTGDYGLHEITDALFGKDSEDAAGVFNAIVGAGDEARDTMVNAARAGRESIVAKAAEVHA